MPQSASPQRPRGPASPGNPHISREHGEAVAGPPRNYAGSSRSNLFGLFSRQPSKSNIKPNAGSVGTSLHSVADSFFGAFDNISLDMSVTSLESPQQAHETGHKVDRMLKSAEKYRKSVEEMSAAAAEFGNTLYECANTKGAASGRTPMPDHYVNTDLQAAGGLHLLISNHAHLLGSSLQSQLVGPVDKSRSEFKTKLANREAEFRSALRTKMQALKLADEQRGRDARRRNRDLLAYRNTLLDLTSQIDDINRLKFEFLSDMHTYSTELAESLHSAIASAVTAEIEVFESIARKGWSGGGLDGLLGGCPDPFAPQPPETPHISPRKSDNNAVPAKLVPKTNSDGSSGSSSISSITISSPADPSANANTNENKTLSPPKQHEEPRSPSNLFSIIPPKPLLPNSVFNETEEEDSDYPKTPHVRRRDSNSSDLANLTLTPLQVNGSDTD